MRSACGARRAPAFRAPTPGQQYLYNVSQGPNLDPAIARSVNVHGQLPSISPIATLLGGEALEPETSVNLSLGLVLQPTPGFSISLDAYRIDIDGRLGLSKSFNLANPLDVTPEQLARIRSSGEPFATEFTNVEFFTNNFDTRTTGVDLVGNWLGRAGPGQLAVTWATNYNRSKYRRYDPTLLNEDARRKFLRSVSTRRKPPVGRLCVAQVELHCARPALRRVDLHRGEQSRSYPPRLSST